LLAVQVHRSNIPTLANVATRLGVDADWILFGHVHRLGPLAGDRPADWQGPGGRPSIANTGAWVYEPLPVHHSTPPHPYRPGRAGGAVVLGGGGPPGGGWTARRSRGRRAPLSGRRRKYDRTERCHWWMLREDAGPPTCSSATRGSEDKAQRRQGRLECDRTYGG